MTGQRGQRGLSVLMKTGHMFAASSLGKKSVCLLCVCACNKHTLCIIIQMCVVCGLVCVREMGSEPGGGAGSVFPQCSVC